MLKIHVNLENKYYYYTCNWFHSVTSKYHYHRIKTVVCIRNILSKMSFLFAWHIMISTVFLISYPPPLNYVYYIRSHFNHALSLCIKLYRYGIDVPPCNFDLFGLRNINLIH